MPRVLVITLSQKPNVRAVRYAHLPEVGVSNFLFGFVAAWLLAGPSHERARDEPVALSA